MASSFLVNAGARARCARVRTRTANGVARRYGRESAAAPEGRALEKRRLTEEELPDTAASTAGGVAV